MTIDQPATPGAGSPSLGPLRRVRTQTLAGLWYFFYFLTDRGRAGLTANRREIARVIWTRNSPEWHFDDATFNRAVAAFDNPDYVDVVIHSYRHRLALAPGYPPYDQIEQELAAQPAISVPAVRLHQQVPRAGHNLPQEAPEAFAGAILELAQLRSRTPERSRS